MFFIALGGHLTLLTGAKIARFMFASRGMTVNGTAIIESSTQYRETSAGIGHR
jgi:hypothetical protein